MNVCIFCSANDNIDRVYFEKAAQLAQHLAKAGHNIVFGGCNSGLMECVAKAAEEAGAMTIGVVPTIVERGSRVSEHVGVKILCDNLSDRKQLMIDKSDAFIALPGGIGTLDEIFTVAASATIGYHAKPLIAYNIDGFWDGLAAMLDGLQAKGMVRGRWTDHLEMANSIEEIDNLLA